MLQAASQLALDGIATRIEALEKQGGGRDQHERFAAVEQIIRELDGLTGGAPLQARAWRLLAELHQLRRDHNAAVEAFERSLKYDGAQPVLHYRIGMAYRETGSDKKAVPALSAAIDGGFRNAGALMNLVEASLVSRESATALQRSRELIEIAGKSHEVMLRLGRLLFSALYYEEALRAFELAAAAAPERHDAQFYAALTSHLTNKPDRAIELLSPLAERRLGGEVLALLGSAQAQKGNYDPAESTFRLAMSRYPESPHAVLNLALVELQRDRQDSARELLEKLREMSGAVAAKVFFHVSRNSCEALQNEIAAQARSDRAPDLSEYFRQLATQILARYHYRTAVELIRLAVASGGRSPELLQAAGLCCLNLAPQSETAMKLLSAAVEADPASAEAWHLLGRAHVRQGRQDQAIMCFRMALEIEPKAVHFLDLGRAYLLSDGTGAERSPEQARTSFEKALELAPDDAAIYYELGRLHAQEGRHHVAKKHLERAADLQPDFYEVYYALGRVCMRLGSTAEARQYLARFVDFRNAAREQAVVKTGYAGEGRAR